MKNKNKVGSQPHMFEVEPVTVFEGLMPIKTLRAKLHPDMPFGLQPSKELSDDIAKFGVHTPIIIEDMNDAYWIRSGKRRFLASEKLGLFNIPCVVRQYPMGMGAVVGLSTNLKRGHNPVDEYHHLIELKAELKSQDKWVSDETLAKQLGITIKQYRKISCIEIMPDEVKVAINNGKITINNAYALAKLAPARQKPLIEKLLGGGRVTTRDIKEQKIVTRQKTGAKQFADIKTTENTNLPKREYIDRAIELMMGDIPLASKNRSKLVDFVIGMMSESDCTLEKILNE